METTRTADLLRKLIRQTYEVQAVPLTKVSDAAHILVTKSGKSNESLRFANLQRKLSALKGRNTGSLLYVLYSLMDTADQVHQPASTGRPAVSRAAPETVPVSQPAVINLGGLSSDYSYMSQPSPALMPQPALPTTAASQVQQIQVNALVPFGQQLTKEDKRLRSEFLFELGAGSSSALVPAGPSPVALVRPEGAVTESELVRDMIYVLQGIDGEFIRFDSSKKMFTLVITDEPTVPRGRYLDTAFYLQTRSLVESLSEAGTLYKKLSPIVKQSGSELSPAAESGGRMLENFYLGVKNELADYFRLLAVLDGQVAALLQRIKNQAIAGGVQEDADTVLSLKRLYVWCEGPLIVMRTLSRAVDVSMGLAGPDIVTKLLELSHHGDKDVSMVCQRLALNCLQPWLHTLGRWLSEGMLVDPHNEFFVMLDGEIAAKEETKRRQEARGNLPDKNESDDQALEFWASRFLLVPKLVPSFLPMDLAQTIHVAGKSINFLRYICNQPTVKADVDEKKLSAAVQRMEDSIREMMPQLLSDLHRQVMKTLLGTWRFMDHCKAIKLYLLGEQGDLIQNIIEVMSDALEAPARSVYRHNLVGLLDQAIRASGLAEPKVLMPCWVDEQSKPECDFVGRLDVRLVTVGGSTEKEIFASRTLKVEPKGWDVFLLEYHLERSPCTVVLSKQSIIVYTRLFAHLWALRRSEHMMAGIWKTVKSSLGNTDYPPETQVALEKLTPLRHILYHFVDAVRAFILCDVIESAWQEYVASVEHAKTLDEVIGAHQKYQKDIVSCAFMPGTAGQLSTILSSILSLVDELYVASNDYGRSCQQYTESTNAEDMTEMTAEMAAKWIDKTTDAVAKRSRESISTFSSKCQTLSDTFDTLAGKYTALHVQFLAHLELAMDATPMLQFLHSRLDFGETFARKT